MWNRKIVTASIASPVYAILLACGVTMMGVRENGGTSGVLNGFLLMTVAYVTVSFPIMLTYGAVIGWRIDSVRNDSGGSLRLFYIYYSGSSCHGSVCSRRSCFTW